MHPRSALLRRVLLRTIAALGIAYIVLNLGRAIQTNYHTSQQIRELKQQIAALTTQTVHLKNTIVYYKSRTYQELEAKRRLGLKRPGETVVLVPGNIDPAPTTPPTLQPSSPSTTPSTDPFDRATANATSWIRWLTTPLTRTD